MKSATLKQTIKRKLPGLFSIAKNVHGEFRAFRTQFSVTGQKFECPICNYRGPFLSHGYSIYPIRFTECPKCSLFERHRLQYLVLNELRKRFDFSRMSILHFAPEPYFSRFFRKHFQKHHTADISEAGVNFEADIRSLPFPDSSYDVLFASHVLEHVDRDDLALAEIKRVLKPNGFAILPVPVVSPHTIEYSAPNPHEFGHVRAIGLDYFDRYRKVFRKTEVWESKNFDPKYQLYTYEDRSIFPTDKSPQRLPMVGEKHSDFVPVCYR